MEEEKAQIVGEEHHHNSGHCGDNCGRDRDHNHNNDSSSDNKHENGSDDEQLTIGFDQHGRIMPPVQGPVNYNFQCIKQCIKTDYISSLVHECNKVFTARATDDGETYSSGETYFVRADAVPRTSLEQLAQEIFKHHSKGLTFDPTKSGAEWWTLCLESDAGVGAHWDKDYGIEADHGVNVFPNISTVTYLSNIGAPTVITQLRAPTMTNEEIAGLAGSELLVSRPVVGKHIAFDGRFLHFASEALDGDCEDDDSDGNEDDHTDAAQRVSFLVNVWFNHTPTESCALPDELVNLCNSKSENNSSVAKAGPQTSNTISTFQHWNANGLVAQDPVVWTCPSSSGSSTGASSAGGPGEGVSVAGTRTVQEEVGETHMLSFCAPLEVLPLDQDISLFSYVDEQVRPLLIRVMDDPVEDEDEEGESLLMVF